MHTEERRHDAGAFSPHDSLKAGYHCDAEEDMGNTIKKAFVGE
jgi:hypothetical protein